MCWALGLNENHPEGVGPVWGQEVLESSSNFLLCEIVLDGRADPWAVRYGQTEQPEVIRQNNLKL